jgi:uridine monophosphate synthetase
MPIPVAKHQAATNNPITHKLLEVMLVKKTRLIVAADVTTTDALINLANKVGPYIAMLKTHIDLIEDFTPYLVDTLQELAQKHQFLLFEDRKIADIGKTSQHQFAKGLYRIAQWADVVTVHGLLGPGLIQALQPLCQHHQCGLLLLAELSNRANLTNPEYAKNVIAFGQQMPQSVLGFVAQKPMAIEPGFLKCTPGIHLDAQQDQLDQQYRTPEQAYQDGADCIIVGRAISQHNDPASQAKRYQETTAAL